MKKQKKICKHKNNLKIKNAHIRVFKLEVDEVARIAESGTPLTAKELEKRGPDEILITTALPEEQPISTLKSKEIPVPANIGDLFFPSVVSAPEFFCFCSSYTWCLESNENGTERYVLKCNYICLPRIPLDIR